MKALAYATLAEQHDADKACFQKKGGQNLKRQERADDVCGYARIAGPVQPDFVRNHDARHDTHGERECEYLRPELRESLIDSIFRAEPQCVQCDDEPGDSDGERRPQEVVSDRERKLEP